MFGEDGWCRSCGTPLREQCGALQLRRAGLAKPEGAWTPNWRFDVLCVGEELASELGRFSVNARPVSWVGRADPPAWQVVLPVVGSRWFDPARLTELAVARHGVAGEDMPVVWNVALDACTDFGAAFPGSGCRAGRGRCCVQPRVVRSRSPVLPEDHPPSRTGRVPRRGRAPKTSRCSKLSDLAGVRPINGVTGI